MNLIPLVLLSGFIGYVLSAVVVTLVAVPEDFFSTKGWSLGQKEAALTVMAVLLGLNSLIALASVILWTLGLSLPSFAPKSK